MNFRKKMQLIEGVLYLEILLDDRIGRAAQIEDHV